MEAFSVSRARRHDGAGSEFWILERSVRTSKPAIAKQMPFRPMELRDPAAHRVHRYGTHACRMVRIPMYRQIQVRIGTSALDMHSERPAASYEVSLVCIAHYTR